MKRIKILMLSVLFFLLSVTAIEAKAGLNTATTIVKFGDIDSDGDIDEDDRDLVYRYLKGETLSDSQKVAADVTGDGEVTLGDVAKINAHISGQLNIITVVFSSEGKDVYCMVPDGEEGTYGELPTLENNSKEGYTFQGWYTKKTSGIKVTSDTKLQNQADHKLYAVWKKKLVKQTITSISSTTKTYGSKAFSLKAKTSGNGKLTYKSSNKKVATVSTAGKVTIKGYGTAKITIKAGAKGNYSSAEKTITIKVVPKKAQITEIELLNNTLSTSWKKDKTVTGYQIQVSKSMDFSQGVRQKSVKAVNVKITDALFENGTYYVRVRAYKTEQGTKYYGSWSSVASTKNIPKKVVLKSVSSPKKKQIKLSWNKISKVTGYQIQISKKFDFSSGTMQNKYSSKVKLPIKVTGLSSKKTYYVKVRAYKKIDGIMYYGNWSAIKKIKIK